MSKNIELSEQQIKELSAQFVQITDAAGKKIGDWKLYYKGDYVVLSYQDRIVAFGVDVYGLIGDPKFKEAIEEIFFRVNVDVTYNWYMTQSLPPKIKVKDYDQESLTKMIEKFQGLLWDETLAIELA